MANNKVQLSNGTVLMDITDTTATASDVASGKYFYNAAGVKVSGTSSGGGGGTAIITDETDIHGGIIRTITTTSEVYLQSKSATPSTSSQSILPDSGFDALSQVNISPIPSAYVIPSGTLSITSNGTYDVGSYASADISVSGSGGGLSIDEVAEKTISGTIQGSASLIASNVFMSYSLLEEVKFPECLTINSLAFLGCISLRSISFPKVTTIKSAAFSSCSALQSVYFPSCTSMDAAVFYSCKSLTTANFPVCTTIGGSEFYGCTKLVDISFPECTAIGGYAFAACTSLETANFPKADNIGNSAFTTCSSLKTISFPLGKYINAYAFNACSRLTEASFPEGSTILGSAFYGCYSLSKIYAPKCPSIYASAFAYCSILTDVYMPSVSNLGAGAFIRCIGLSFIRLPKASIFASSVFRDCYSLNTIIIGEALTTGTCSFNGASNFANCYNLLSLYLLAYSVYKLTGVAAFTSTPISDYTTSTGGVYGSIFVPSSLYDSYISANNWSVYSARFSSLTDAQIQNVIQYGTHNP